MSRRTTSKEQPVAKSEPTFRPQTLRQRSPLVYWVAVLAVLCLFLTSFAGALALALQ